MEKAEACTHCGALAVLVLCREVSLRCRRGGVLCVFVDDESRAVTFSTACVLRPASSRAPFHSTPLQLPAAQSPLLSRAVQRPFTPRDYSASHMLSMRMCRSRAYFTWDDFDRVPGFPGTFPAFTRSKCAACNSARSGTVPSHHHSAAASLGRDS